MGEQRYSATQSSARYGVDGHRQAPNTLALKSALVPITKEGEWATAPFWMEARTAQPVASCYADYDIRTSSGQNRFCKNHIRLFSLVSGRLL
jgi:hypothetical protein